jgi:hypothetical protein
MLRLQAQGDAVWRDLSSHLVVCNAAVGKSSITFLYPGGLAPFFTDESLHKAFEPGNFLNKVSIPSRISLFSLDGTSMNDQV